VNASDPIVRGDHVLISTGYNKGAALLKIESTGAVQVWQNRAFRNQFTSSVLVGGHVYGIDNDESKAASLKCIDFLTGEVKWTDEGVGFGSLMAADGKLIVLASKGELITAKASPTKWRRCWTASRGPSPCSPMGAFMCAMHPGRWFASM
jgi:hypothetical protein